MDLGFSHFGGELRGTKDKVEFFGRLSLPHGVSGAVGEGGDFPLWLDIPRNGQPLQGNGKQAGEAGCKGDPRRHHNVSIEQPRKTKLMLPKICVTSLGYLRSSSRERTGS